MREPLKDRVRLEHILTAIDNIFQFTEGKTIKQLNDDAMMFYAMEGRHAHAQHSRP